MQNRIRLDSVDFDKIKDMDEKKLSESFSMHVTDAKTSERDLNRRKQQEKELFIGESGEPEFS